MYSFVIIVLTMFPHASVYVSWCCILTYDPAKHAIPKTAEVHIPLARRAWLTIWDRVKIPRYSHKLMHRKRVTCELHDSYFRSMTIIHAIPKTAEVTHSDGQLWGDIERMIELLYNSLKTGRQFFGDRRVWRKDVVEKANT